MTKRIPSLTALACALSCSFALPALAARPAVCAMTDRVIMTPTLVQGGKIAEYPDLGYALFDANVRLPGNEACLLKAWTDGRKTVTCQLPATNYASAKQWFIIFSLTLTLCYQDDEATWSWDNPVGEASDTFTLTLPGPDPKDTIVLRLTDPMNDGHIRMTYDFTINPLP